MIRLLKEERFGSLPASKRQNLMFDYWVEEEEAGRGKSVDRVGFFRWLEDKGYDLTDYSDNDYFYDEDDVVDKWERYERNVPYIGDIRTRKDAYRWLQSKLAEYGDTRNFDAEDRLMLDFLTSCFGNTYFWSNEEY